MARERLMYLSEHVLQSLRDGVEGHLDRYRSGDFQDLVAEGNWSIELSIESDLDELKHLDPSTGPEAEIENSLRVWKALHALTPSIACEERFWARLSHVDCLDFSRRRWLKESASEEKQVASIRTHLFARGQTGCRDDHAISRLWWNARIAKGIWPEQQREALELMLKSADIRSNLIERVWTVGRQPIAAGILRAIARVPAITATEQGFRDFMQVVNRKGGGVVFEVLSDSHVDRFMDECIDLTVGEQPASA